MQSGKRLPIPSLWDCGPINQGGIPHVHSGMSDTSTIAMGKQTGDPTPGPQQRMRTIVDNIMSPFKACVLPPMATCGTSDVPTRRWTPNIQVLQPYCSFSEETYASTPPRASSIQSQSSASVESPRENDILCGRGGSSNRHPGNLQFRQLIAANKAQYTGLTKKQKMMLARLIVEVVHHAGGRFLARDNQTGAFYDVGLPRSLEKTSQALRERQSGNCDVSVETSAPVKTYSGTVPAPILNIPPHLKSVYKVPTVTPSSPAQMSPFPTPVSSQYPPPYPTSSSAAPMMPFITPSDQPPRIPHVVNDQPPHIPQVHHSATQHPPETPQDWKRPRIIPQSPLPLEERVVGPRPSSLMSPSGALQGRTHSRGSGRMDGLSALSTAAFLRLDDEA